MSFASVVFAQKCAESDRKRDEGLTIPKDVSYVRNISYGNHKKYHVLDICWPKTWEGRDITPEEKLPVIISVHGGGYVYGTKEVYQFYAASLAQKGFAVINFNYRLAPKFKFPAPLEDLNSVIEWMLAHQEQYPIDTDKVFFVGDSAGAQIASQYGVIYSNEEYAKVMEMKVPKFTLKALGLCCGTYDLKKRAVTSIVKGIISDYLTKNPQKFGEKLNVLEHITKDYPPTYLFSSKGDFLVEECKPMAELLQSKGIYCDYRIYGTEETYHVFHVDVRNEFGAQANNDQIAFFQKTL